MAQDIKINGTNYSAVPAISVPTQSGGTASFIDETSAVLYTTQTGKTDSEKQIARTNIGAGTGNGSVTSITLKATSPITIDSTAAITTSGTRTFGIDTSGTWSGTATTATTSNKIRVNPSTTPTETGAIWITTT